MQKEDDQLLSALLAHERQVWDALVTGDPTTDEALLSADFLGVYPSGFSDRDDHSGQLSGGPSVLSYALDLCQARALGADHALLSYRARFRRTDAEDNETMYVSSVWQRRQDGWINVFSQDTPADA